ncbi:MAG TPA: hypothetical protein VFP84_07995 [Kofleriaceae bacterium]|nr:hypothetical protein [Kofleriaceae bacterium]
MRARELLACALLVAASAPAAAKGKKDADPDSGGDDVVTVDDGNGDDAADARPAKKKKKKAADDEGGGGDDGALQKQDLNGHDLGATKKANVFERDRFFVDKTDTAKTEKGTLIQGSLTETSFAYHESGGNIPTTAANQAAVPTASPFNRLYTELRLQTDFRHIGGGRWDARIDVRGRAVNNPDPTDPNPAGPAGFTPITNSRIQSGFLGKNELDLRELWLVRNGIRSDVFIGRQFVPDLGGVKIDGVRIDYASSTKFTLLGFGGLYPERGSRSLVDDYRPLLSSPDNEGNRTQAGRFVGAAGFGAAYRVPDAYGSFGGVALAPFSSESPQIYGTSSGYWRYGSKLDFYHFAVVNLVGSDTANSGLSNISLGLNYKPDQRLRGTLSFNRVSTETLNVQAQAFLEKADPALNAVQNEAYLQRIATNEARGSLSAGLGELQRFEITAALTYRRRGDLNLSPPPQDGMITAVKLPAAQSVEAYGSITDRRSIKDLRLGVDGSRSFSIGGAAFQRTTSLQVRGFASHDLSNGHGEWEAEVAYSATQDDGENGKPCADLATCFGSSTSNILSIGGTLYYRFTRDWFAFGSAFLNRTAVTSTVPAVSKDPAVIGVSGLFRIAYRF